MCLRDYEIVAAAYDENVLVIFLDDSKAIFRQVAYWIRSLQRKQLINAWNYVEANFSEVFIIINRK